MYTIGRPRFAVGDKVTDGRRIGKVCGRAYNQLLKREHTDRWIILVYYEDKKRCKQYKVAGDGKLWKRRK